VSRLDRVWAAGGEMPGNIDGLRRIGRKAGVETGMAGLVTVPETAILGCSSGPAVDCGTVVGWTDTTGVGVVNGTAIAGSTGLLCLGGS